MSRKLEITNQTVVEGYDRKTGWFQPRIAWLEPNSALLTMSRNQLWGSDIFMAIHTMHSDDGGATWSTPQPQARMDRHTYSDGYEVCPCDMTPALHAASGKVLATGHTAVYKPLDRGGELSTDNTHGRDVCYAVYDPATREWDEWQIMDLPDKDFFYWIGAGCSQRVDLDDGTILLPIYGCSRNGIGGNAWRACYFSTVARVAFDGKKLTYISHGDVLSIPDPRGFCEPSLTFYQGEYYFTLRNDLRAYITRSKDGLHFEKPIPWLFDDGSELGSYNTQQRWVTHQDGLYLSYTRSGANNDEVIRHRAPLFIARIDPERLTVMRDTEQILVPNRGAQLGNFGAVNVSDQESWVMTSECMLGDAKEPFNLDLTEKRGANNRVIIAKIR